MRRRLDLLTMRDFFVAVVLSIIFVQMNVQAVRYKRIYLRSTRGSFSSPNYPGPYPQGIHYEWIMPMTSKKLQIEFVEMDLYNCYVRKRRRNCDNFDYVYIMDHEESYCNWNKPTKPITFLPWTQASITFSSSDYLSTNCKGRGFKADYRPVGPRYETTAPWSTETMPTTTLSPTTRSKTKDSLSNTGNRSTDFSAMFLLLLLAIPLILVVVCLYCMCCRRSRPSPTVNHDALRTTVNNWSYQTATPAVPHPVQNTYQDDSTLLTVDIPPLSRTTRLSDGVIQTRRPRQDYDDELLETSAQDPPPSYDEVWEDDHLNRSRQSFESPPSYEAAMRESNQSLENIDRNEGTDHNDRERYNNDFQGNVQSLNLQPNTSNEANSGMRRFEVTI